MFRRKLHNTLLDWKKSKSRKPLVLRGARQVGKTTIVSEFAKSYKNFVLLNLEKDLDFSFFEEGDDVHSIMDSIFLSRNIEAKSLNDTLLFIDEIQESPKAIQLLRYFYEDLPELHVIAAGSLLEFAIKKVANFPVGRVEYLYLHPMNFPEFLEAIDQRAAFKQINQIPIPEFAHSVLKELFHKYLIMGGMPEVIKDYVANNSYSQLPRVYESIWKTYQEDVEKYAKGEAERKVIKHIMSTAHLSLDKRVKFQNFGNSNYKSREVGEALRSLNDAKIIQLIYPTTDVEFPLIPNLKKSPRLQFLDTGLINHALGIQSELLGLKDFSTAFKGAITPHIITQELISLNEFTNNSPNFWVRDKKQSSAEVDLVYQYKSLVIPIEIKSGVVGTLKSLHQFINECPHGFAIRIYGGKYIIENHVTPAGKPYVLMNLPYYLGTKIPEYVAVLLNTQIGNQFNQPV